MPYAPQRSQKEISPSSETREACLQAQISRKISRGARSISSSGRIFRSDTIIIDAICIPEISRGDFPVIRDARGLSPVADFAEHIQRREVDVLSGQHFSASIQTGEEKVFDNRVIATNTIAKRGNRS